jgi:hypothetical protein
VLKAVKNKEPVNIKLSYEQIKDGDMVLPLTSTQIMHLVRNFDKKKGSTLKLSNAQLRNFRSQGMMSHMVTGGNLFDEVKSIGSAAFDTLKKIGKKALAPVTAAACELAGTAALGPEALPAVTVGCAALAEEVSNAVGGKGMQTKKKKK